MGIRPDLVQNYKCNIKHDGAMYEVVVTELHVPKCEACGRLFFDNDADAQVRHALREQLGLLQPDQIREQRNALGLTQAQLAKALRVAPETISRWETGGIIQTAAMDRLMRLYFTLPEVRSSLAVDMQGLNQSMPDVVGIEIPSEYSKVVVTTPQTVIDETSVGEGEKQAANSELALAA
jgi:HTH-type transcriptional regulator/antitoxin MqsA